MIDPTNSKNKNVEICECKAEEITILPYSGDSNVGQIANQAAVSLDNLEPERFTIWPASVLI
jgi:uncharacterized metal-binding protein